ncbi:MAG: hypothetical protein AAGC45_08885 [Bacteroidota bacterium]
MRSVVFFLVLAVSLNAYAQSIEELQSEIDTQVWKPFKKAFEHLDAKALNSIYADQVLRVTPAGIDTENAFRKKNIERFEERRNEGIAIALDFWFDSRHTNANTSYEVGFYRIGFSSVGGKDDFVYGQFHIVLQKLNGVWKITQDWDTTTLHGKAISAEDFKSKPIQRF